MNEQEIESREKLLGAAASRALTGSLQNQVVSVFNRRTGAMEKTRVAPRYKFGRLDRLVMTSPHYSFKEHFGSDKSGVTSSTTRKGASVRSFTRKYEGMVRQVKAHTRSGGSVNAHTKGIKYTAKNHIANALKATDALDVLATGLGANRAVKILSSFDI